MFLRKFLLGASIVVNAVLVWSLVWGDHGIGAYRVLKEECAMLDRHIAELDERNLELSREIRLLQSDDKYVEKMIRDRGLNLVRDNEILYIFPESSENAGAKADESKN